MTCDNSSYYIKIVIVHDNPVITLTGFLYEFMSAAPFNELTLQLAPVTSIVAVSKCTTKLFPPY